MSRVFTIGFFFIVCIGSACYKKSEKQLREQAERAKQKEQDFLKSFQDEFSKGEGVTYRFDPFSETCVAVKEEFGAGFGWYKYSWPVPCAKVKDKLDPSVRGQVEDMLKKLPAECPR